MVSYLAKHHRKLDLPRLFLHAVLFAVFVLPTPVFALTATINSVSLFLDGACTAASRTHFRFNVDVNPTVDDGGNLDQFTMYLVDGSGLILVASDLAVSVFVPTLNFNTSLPTSETPTVGPFTAYVVEDTDNAPDQAQGANFALTPLASFTFDANAIDPDCPAAPSVPAPSTSSVNHGAVLQGVSAQMAVARGAARFARLPDLAARSQGAPRARRLDLSVTQHAGALHFASDIGAAPGGWQGWTEADAAFTKAEIETRIGNLSFGFDRALRSDLRVGVMTILDYGETVTGQSQAASRGVLFGPYAVFNLQAGTIVEGLVTAGRVESDMTSSDGVSATSRSDRLFAFLKVSHGFYFGRLWLEPSGSLAIYEERAAAFSLSNGGSQVGYDLDMRELRLGAEVHYAAQLLGSDVLWRGGIHGVGTQTRHRSLASPIAGPDGGSISADVGLDLLTGEGGLVRFDAGANGLADPDYATYTFGLRFDIVF